MDGVLESVDVIRAVRRERGEIVVSDYSEYGNLFLGDYGVRSTRVLGVRSKKHKMTYPDMVFCTPSGKTSEEAGPLSVLPFFNTPSKK